MALSDEKKRKAGRRKDAIWEHAAEENDGFICNYCGVFYKGGASRIKSHLSGKTGGGIRPCPSAPSGLIEDPKVATISSDLQTLPSSDNNPISRLSFTGEERKETDTLVAKFLNSNNLPLETVEQPCFRNLITKVARLGPGYKLPSCSDLQAEYPLPNLQRLVEQYFKTIRESWLEYGCTVVIHWKEDAVLDGNGSLRESDIVGYTVYSPKGVVYLNSQDHSTSLSNFEHFIYNTQKAMKQYSVRILQCVHSKAFPHPNLLKSFANRCFPQLCATSWILHNLEVLSVESEWISNLVKDANSIYEYLTTRASEIFSMRREQNSNLGSKYDYENTFSKLIVVLKHKTQLQNISPTEAETSGVSHIINKEKLWQDGEEFLLAVAPFLHFLHLFSSFVPDGGYFHEAIEKAQFRFQDYFDANRDKFEGIPVKIFDMDDYLVVFDEYKVTAYLNPCYMFNNPNNDEMVEYLALEELCCNFQGLVGLQKESLSDQMQIYGRKEPSLFTEKAISKLHELHPVLWWQEFGGTVVPELTKLAIPLLSQPSCIDLGFHTHNFESLDMLSINANLMEKFPLLEQQEEMFKPIDLGKLDEPLY